MNKQIIKNTLILVGITLIAGLALGLVYDITKDPIAKQHQLTKERACKSVFKEADSFDTEHALDVSKASEVLKEEYEGCSIEEVIPALDKDGTCIGYAMTVTCSEGYGGDITFMMGVTIDGTLNGIDFLTLNETAGLGMNAKEDNFKNQFQGKQAEKLDVTKNDSPGEDEIQAISAATITSNAVTKGVNAGLAYFRTIDGTKGGES
ncbi:MAG: RnfABCDGE type electron transport complex subunit G [Lachnospiraceae bacterium]|nr:RnfABCDGE type electron transport complex subunit G [Lachnospiraceae bacterium]